MRLAVLETSEELHHLDLPREYMVKVRHGSGGSVVVWDGPASEGPEYSYPWPYCSAGNVRFRTQWADEYMGGLW